MERIHLHQPLQEAGGGAGGLLRISRPETEPGEPRQWRRVGTNAAPGQWKHPHSKRQNFRQTGRPGGRPLHTSVGAAALGGPLAAIMKVAMVCA